MSLKIDRAELEIVIKNDTSRKRMRELDDDMRKLRREMKKLDENSPEFQGKLTQLKAAQAEYDKLIDKIGITGLTLKELRKRQQELNTVLAHIPGNSPLYDKYREQLTQVNDRMKELKGTSKETEGSLSKLANGFNKYFAMGASLIAGITGASMAFRSMAEEVAKVDDLYSDVMKTTGLTHDEVVALNEEFKNMDTRTSRDELNKLATEAGKIGRSGKKDIMDFVEAGNQIRVALGEDLGEDAITSIGKMVSVFEGSTKQLQGVGLKEQMLSVGSAINELGASSTAAEPYLVQFAGRMGGVSKQAKISMADILGYASALDQDMQQVEMSATALQNFIMKLMGDPAKFAKQAGLNVKEFTKLLNTDTNAAIKQVLKALNEKGGFQALIPIFQEMGLDGARATGVLSSMAGSIDKIDVAQRIANQAMTDGVSITKEYGLKNDNLAAQLEKVKKNFRETQLELGAKLNPILLTSTNYLTYMTKGLVILIKHWGTVSKLALIIAGYTAAYNGKLLLNNLLLKEGIGLKAKELILKAKDAVVLQVLIVREALHAAMINKTTLATKAAAIAQVIWNNVIKANPLGALLAVITTVAAGIWLITSRMREASQAEISAINVKKKVAEQYDVQEAKIRMLIGILNDEKVALGERRKALEELKGIVPGYHADLTNEGKLINNNKDAIKDYLVELEKQIYLDAIKEEKTALLKKKREQEKNYAQKQQSAESAKTASNTTIVGESSFGTSSRGMLASQAQVFANSAKRELDATTEALKKLDEEYAKVSNTVTKKAYTGPKDGDKQQIDGVWCTYKGGKWIPDKVVTTGGGSGTGDPNKDKVAELDRQLLKEQMALKQAKKSKEQTDIEMLDLDVKYLTKKRDLYKKDSAEWLEYQNKLVDIANNKTITANAAEIKTIEDANRAKILALEIYENEKREQLQQGLDDGTKTQEEYNAEIAALGVTLAEQRLKDAQEYQELISSATFNTEADKQKAVEAAKTAVTAANKELTKANKAVIKNKLDAEKDHLKKVADLRKELGLDKEKLGYKEGLKALKKKLKDAEASEKESADKIAQYRAEKVQEFAQSAVQITGMVSDVVGNIHQAQADNLEATKNKELKAAGDNAAKREEIEKKYAQKELELKKKQANANMGIQIAQALAQGALGIAEIWAKTGVNPILAAILTAGLVAVSGVQIAAAVAQRNAIQNQTLGFRSGGYTGDGRDDEPAGTVHRGEFVANAKAVRNPHVRKFLDVFNQAQMNGGIRMLNTTQILQQVQSAPAQGYQSGGYVAPTKTSVGVDVTTEVLRQNTEVMRRLQSQIENGIPAYSVISGRNGSAEMTKKYEKYISNASRT